MEMLTGLGPTTTRRDLGIFSNFSDGQGSSCSAALPGLIRVVAVCYDRETTMEVGTRAQIVCVM